MTNILITGIQGFVGAHLANYLSQDSNNKIYGLTRSLKKESTFNALNLHNKKNINLAYGNVTNTIVTDIILDGNIDQVYHIAAEAIVKTSNLSPICTYNTNIFGTMYILESIRQISRKLNKKISVLVTSSDKAYGDSPKLPYTEDMPLNGLDIYSSSKACQDIIARTYANNYDMPIVVSRACNIYGEYDFNWSRVIPQFIKSYLDNSKITIYENTMFQIREYIYIDDLVKAITLLMKNIDITKGQAYNITSGQPYTVAEIIDTFKKVTNYNNIEYTTKEKNFKEIKEQTLDDSKLLDAIDWSAKIDLDCRTLNKIIDAYKKCY